MTRYQFKGFRGDAVLIEGDDDSFHVARQGRFLSDYGFYEKDTSSGNSIVVDGAIDAHLVGILADGASTSVHIGRTGTVQAAAAVNLSGDGSSVLNRGTIFGSNIGIAIGGVGSTATNEGVLSSTYGLSTDGNDTALINGARGRVEAVFAGFFSSAASGESVVMYNHGTVITAERGYAAYGGDEDTTLINDGRMSGQIWLGDGFNIVDLSHGQLKGRITGGADDDMLITDKSRYHLFEGEGRGTDSVISSASYVLDDNVERLTLSGKKAISGTGSYGDNWLYGNAAGNALSGMNGNDWLDGRGGDDDLTGGQGFDVFVFGRAHGKDVITDFANGVDRLNVGGWLETTEFEEIMKHVKDDDSGAVISFDRQSLTLVGMQKADITVDDFVF